MRRELKRGGVAAAAALLLLAAAAAHTWYFTPLFIDALYARVFASFALDRLQVLTSMDLPPRWLDSGKVDDLSPAQDKQDQRSAQDSLDTLRRYPRSTMDGDAALSYDTLRFFLQARYSASQPLIHHSFTLTQLTSCSVMARCRRCCWNV